MAGNPRPQLRRKERVGNMRGTPLQDPRTASGQELSSINGSVGSYGPQRRGAQTGGQSTSGTLPQSRHRRTSANKEPTKGSRVPDMSGALRMSNSESDVPRPSGPVGSGVPQPSGPQPESGGRSRRPPRAEPNLNPAQLPSTSAVQHPSPTPTAGSEGSDDLYGPQPTNVGTKGKGPVKSSAASSHSTSTTYYDAQASGPENQTPPVRSESTASASARSSMASRKPQHTTSHNRTDRQSFLPGQDMLPRTRKHSTHRDASARTKPELASGVVNLRRADSKRRDPRVEPGRGPSDASRRSHGSRRLNRGDSRRSEPHPAGRVATDSSRISTLHSRSSDGSYLSRNTGLFGAMSKLTSKKGTKTETNKEKETDKKLKDKIINNLERVAEISKTRFKKNIKDYLKPTAHDIIENTAAYGRMIQPVATLLAPAAIMALWAWDSLQYVETNRKTCKDLLTDSVDQHGSFVLYLDQSMTDQDLDISDLGPVEQALEKHKDACKAIYRAVLAQKNQRYIIRFIKRKKIGEKELKNASIKLALAKDNFSSLMSSHTWANTVAIRKAVVTNWEPSASSSRRTVDYISILLPEIMKTEGARDALAERMRKDSETARQAEALAEVLTLGTQMTTMKNEMNEMEPEELSSVISELEKLLEDDTREKKLLEKGKGKRHGSWNEHDELQRIIVEHRLNICEKILQRGGMKDQGTQTDDIPGSLSSTNDPNHRELERRTSRTVGDGSVGHNRERRTSTGTARDATPVRRRRARGSRHQDLDGDRGADHQSTGLDGPKPAPLIPHESYATIYEKRLSHNFSSNFKLRQPLWTPSYVKVGYVGYIDEDGQFILLFDARHLRNYGILNNVKLEFPELRHRTVEDSIKDSDRDTITKTSRVRRFVRRGPKSNERFFEEIGKKERRVVVKNFREMASSASEKQAFIVTERAKYRHFHDNDIASIKTWFNRTIGDIGQAYESLITKDKIILVTGILTAKRWGLLVTREEVNEPIRFCKTEKGRKWGFYAIGNSRVLGSDSAAVSKISHEPDSGRSDYQTVLLSRLRFRVKEGIVEKECNSK